MEFFKRFKKYDIKSEVLKYSTLLFYLSFETSKEIRNLNPSSEEGDSLRFTLIFELMYCYLHYTDRTLFADFGEKARDEIMDILNSCSLESAIESLCTKNTTEMNQKLYSDILRNYEEASIQYTQCTHIIGDADNFEGSLLWECSKQTTLQNNMENDFICLMPTYTFISTDVIELTKSDFWRALKQRYN